MNLRLQRVPSIAAFLLLSALGAACSEASKPAAPPAAAQPEAPKAPLVEKAQIADWCPEHGVPESICTRCNAKLIPDFQAKGDWCKEHGLPESQCVPCHPELEATLKAMDPRTKG